MPPKRFEGKFSIPPSHPVESLITSALYRLPESVNIREIERQIEDITTGVNTARAREGMGGVLTQDEIRVLTLKLVRHYEDSGEFTHLDMPTMVDALVESPKFLESDKGSIEKLFELHEMKTLQKIAEIRKRRAEITTHGGEEFNPYENLFETESGRYYVARLLNMPHLEDESTYMHHCVGTSASYVNKMKKGDVEIFSFREKETDKPVVTIEYDTKSHRLLQVKALNDRLPTLQHAFASDLIDAIEKLSETVNDQREKRVVASKEALHLKQLFILKDKKEPFTRDELRFLYEIDEKIQGFDLGREPVIDELRKDRKAEEDMLIIFECTKDQIANTLSEVTENTKVYVGQLEPGIFRKLPEAIERVYISFPEKEIRIELVEIGGKSKEQLISELEAPGFFLSDTAKSMMENPDFIVGTHREEVKLVLLTVNDLGFKAIATTDQIYVATTDQIYERAQTLGLELCPPDTGPNYRLKYRNQPLDGWVGICMKQIMDEEDDPSIFDLHRIDGDLWISGSYAGPEPIWRSDNELMFRFHKVKA